MHFPIVYEYKPDIQGINLENEIPNEPRKLNPQDKKIEIIIPKYAPFFTKSLELTKRDGSPLKPGVDYRIHRIMGGLTERAGQGVGSTIEILNKSLSEVLISYKTLGHFALIDNSVLQTIIDVGEDDRIIHWDDLHGKPVAFPPKLHSHSLNDEITSLGDILDILGDFTKIMQEKMDDRTQTEKVQNYLELLKHYIKVNTDMVRELVTRHENTKNSHGLTKHQIGLSNVENNPTGDLSNIINKDGGYKVKPGDFDAYLNSKLPKSDNFLKQGVIPINQYGSDEYIPPPISGSFEAFGMASEKTVFEETPEDLILLKNRYDGRVGGLYYSVVRNFKTNPVMTYTNHRYNHPFLEARIGHPTRIGQAGKESIIMGNGSRVFIGLTAGSLNPAKHKFSELDFSDLTHLTSKATYGNLNYASTVCMGRWVYVFYNISTVGSLYGGGSRSLKLILKFLRSEVGVKDIIKPIHVKPTYTDMSGVRRNKVDAWQLGDYVREPSGNWSKYIFDFKDDHVENRFLLYRGTSEFISDESSNVTTPSVRMMHFIYFIHNKDKVITTAGIESVYKWNTETDTLEAVLYHPKELNRGEYNNYVVGTFTRIDYLPSAVATSYGVMSTYMSTSALTTLANMPYRPGKKRDDLFTTQLIANVVQDRGLYIREQPDYPVISVPYVTPPILDQNGYYFYAIDRETGTRDLFYKKTPGGYAIRPEIKVDRNPKMYSKPLSSNIYKVTSPEGKMTWSRFTVTTDFKTLSNKGLTSGVGGTCHGMTSKYSVCLKDPTDPDAVVIPGNITRTINEVTKVVDWVVDVKIRYSSTVLMNFFRAQGAVINDGNKVSVEIFDPSLNKEMQQHFKELPTIIVLYVHRPESDITDLYHYTVRGNGAVSGGVKNITSITLIDKPQQPFTVYRVTEYNITQYINNASWHYEKIPGFFFDYAKREIMVLFGGSYRFGVTGGAHDGGVLFYLDMDTGKIKTLNSSCGDYTGIVPGLGLATKDNDSSGVANVWKSTKTDESILMASGYLETGWVVYFGSSLDVVLSGQSFRIQPGSIDLRDINPNPQNKTFYIYVLLRGGKVMYEITEEKKMESNSLLWVGSVKTSSSKIEEIERFNAFTINGVKVSQRKQGNAIPATSGSINEEGQLPWLTRAELGLLF